MACKYIHNQDIEQHGKANILPYPYQNCTLTILNTCHTEYILSIPLFDFIRIVDTDCAIIDRFIGRYFDDILIIMGYGAHYASFDITYYDLKESFGRSLDRAFAQLLVTDKAKGISGLAMIEEYVRETDGVRKLPSLKILGEEFLVSKFIACSTYGDITFALSF